MENHLRNSFGHIPPRTAPPREYSSLPALIPAVSHLSVELVSDMRCQCSISFFTIFSLHTLDVGEENMSNEIVGSCEIYINNLSYIHRND